MENLKVTGIVLTMDKYDKMRLYIEDQSEINKVINYIKQDSYVKFPFEDKSCNTLIITLKNHKNFWKNKIKENRGKTVTVEAVSRLWNMPPNKGISLDLINLSE